MPDSLDISVVCLLARYWEANPQACDTLIGIAQWWFSPDAPQTVESLERALAALADMGCVEALNAVDGRVRYRWRAGAIPPAHCLQRIAQAEG